MRAPTRGVSRRLAPPLALAVAACGGMSSPASGAAGTGAGTGSTTDAIPAVCVGATPGHVSTVHPGLSADYALFGDDLLVCTNDGIDRVPRGGSAVTSYAKLDEPREITVVGQRVFVFGSVPAGTPVGGKQPSSTALLEVLADGTSKTILDGAWGDGMVAAGSTLYWSSPGAGIETYDLATSEHTTIALERGGGAEALAVGADGVYLAVHVIDGNGGSGTGKIQKIALADGKLSTIVDGLVQPSRIAVDAAHVYFDDWVPEAGWFNGAPRLYRAPLAGGDKQTLLADVVIDAIATDATNVYFATPESLQRMPAGGGAAVTLVTGLEAPGELRVLGGNAYWLNDTTPSGSDPNPPYGLMTTCK